MDIASVEDVPPYPVSDAYAVESVPTLYVVGEDGRSGGAVGAWDRDGFNRVASRLAELTGGGPVVVSTPDDGRPDFKPGVKLAQRAARSERSRSAVRAVTVAAGGVDDDRGRRTLAALDSFLLLVPSWVPWQTAIVWVTGVMEIALQCGARARPDGGPRRKVGWLWPSSCWPCSSGTSPRRSRGSMRSDWTPTRNGGVGSCSSRC